MGRRGRGAWRRCYFRCGPPFIVLTLPMIAWEIWQASDDGLVSSSASAARPERRRSGRVGDDHESEHARLLGAPRRIELRVDAAPRAPQVDVRGFERVHDYEVGRAGELAVPREPERCRIGRRLREVGDDLQLVRADIAPGRLELVWPGSSEQRGACAFGVSRRLNVVDQRVDREI